MITSTADAAGTKKKTSAKPSEPVLEQKRPATVDMDNVGESDEEGEHDRDRKRPKRGPRIEPEKKQADGDMTVPKPGPIPSTRPIEMQLKRGSSKRFDVRALPARKPKERERPEFTPPARTPMEIESSRMELPPSIPVSPTPKLPAPPPNVVFEGLDREFWGSGSPPDTTGDVGPTYYIQGVNASVGIYDKTGNQQAAFTFDTLMSQGAFGNLCDTENFGDPVILYDTFEDRWVLTDFAFLTDGGGNPLGPAFQCFAVSQTNNPLTGGWHFYSIQLVDFLNDYEKLAIWPDGIYMSANMFGFGPGGTFQTARAWAFNKMQMYAGSPTVQVVAFNIPGGDFTVIPSNARLQTGTPPPGTPNLFVSSWQFTNALTVYKFHVDWNSIGLSTFTGPDTPLAATSWPNAAVANAPQPGTANLLDVLQIRSMIQNQYTNMGGVESLWVPHTVRRANTTGFAAPRWYQVNVTGGTVNAALPQAATWDPDAANVMHRYMPSLAVNRNGDMAIGYSISNATTMFPSIAYAGRLAGDPVNTFSQTETMMFTGTASQTTSTRWGDYSTMTLDPDGCTFWYTNEYANPADQTAQKRWKTKIGSFNFPGCTPFGAGGTVTGTVTVTPGGAPLSGATVNLGVRTATTNGSGIYSFLNIPAGTYPLISATKPGYSTASASGIVVTDAGTTVQDFALSLAPTSACLADTTEADFQTGVLTTVDITTSSGNVTLQNIAVDQQNTAGTTTGTGFGTPAWTGQTFIPSVSGQLLRAEFQVFCNGCGATPPNLTLSVRATAAGLPTGADLASVTVSGSLWASGATVTHMATFSAPTTLTAGTQYALVLRPVSAPAGSGYFWIRSSPSTYANGSRVLSANSGGTWTADTTRDFNFKTVIQGPFVPPNGNIASSTKDSNPLGGLTPIWSNVSWNGTTPANTTLQFQVAGSNNPGGPFTFVGPDGTAGTFFTTSPGTLTPLYNRRYAKYKAYLATTNNAVTPVLNDVTMCFNDVDCSAPITITPTIAQVCPSSTGNTASGPAGATSYAWLITNGSITSATNIQTVTYTAGPSGNVGLTLNIVEASGCQKSASLNVPISNVPQPMITGTSAYCAGSSTSLTSSSATGNQWYLAGNPLGGATSQTYVATAPGNYTVQVTDGFGCLSAQSSVFAVTENPLPTAPAITPGGPTTFCAPGSVTLTSDAGSGNQWRLNGNAIGGATNTTYVASANGSYTVTTTDGNGCTSLPSAAVVVTVNPLPAQPTITPGGPTTFCTGGSVTLTSNSATGNQWFLNGNPIGGGTNQTYIANANGSYTVQVTDGNSCVSPLSAGTTVTVNPLPAQPTITPGGPTTFCAGGSVTLTSSSATGNQWSLNGNPIGGATAQNYVATLNGNYTVVSTDGNGCPSPASTATTVTVNPGPAAPTIIPSGPTTFCAGGSVTLTSSSATGNQWLLNGNPIGGANAQNYLVTAGGSYSVQFTDGSGCLSSTSTPTVVTVNPLPAKPTITPGGPTTFCTGGSVTLTSSSATGNQWLLNGNPIGGATAQNYVASGAGSYTVQVTDGNNCPSPISDPTSVTVNPIPSTPTITPSGPTSFCAGGSVTLTSSSATGNQWRLNGSPIGGATNQTYIASVAGDYTVTVTAASCTSAPSATATVTVNPIPNATISAPASVFTTSTGNAASVANAGLGATYNWGISGGTITGGAGTPNITFTAGAIGTLTLNVTVTTGAGCSDSDSATVAVTASPIVVTVTSVTPAAGKTTGGKAVTVSGANFQSGATITFGGSAATSVVFVNSTTLTAVTPAHAAGPVNVTVTNPDTSTGTKINGYTYLTTQFDANGDGIVDPSDIFYLVNYLFLSGPAPAGAAGMSSGDANGDGVVDPADIFYIVNYLFLGGTPPAAEAPKVQTLASERLAGSISLGEPFLRNGRYVVPVSVAAAQGSITPQAMALRVTFNGPVSNVSVHRAGTAAGIEPAFEISRRTPDALVYLLAFGERGSGIVPGASPSVIAEIELESRPDAGLAIQIDPALTMLTDQSGTRSAKVSAGTLRVTNTRVRLDRRQQPVAN
jgi:hypothetical protein